MDSVVDSLNSAYLDFIAAAATVLEARETSTALKNIATDTALESFKQKWELFRVACDQAEEYVESVKQRIGSECLVDEATGHVAGKPGQATMTVLLVQLFHIPRPLLMPGFLKMLLSSIYLTV
uniref:Mediator of RNA polymerase II transcription subunit 32 n=1 Tax=Medicago truncatula TaxID=3880 RepID=B7FI71_MEDTR|nr:unknown [Medicago truncatula]AFK48437.1 unknown [Medicago truncatula]